MRDDRECRLGLFLSETKGWPSDGKYRLKRIRFIPGSGHRNHAWNTIPGCFPYNVAKAGLLGLVQSLAIGMETRVRAVGIAPGFMDTAGNQSWFDHAMTPVQRKKIRQAIIDSGLSYGMICYTNPSSREYANAHWIRGKHNWNAVLTTKHYDGFCL